ncbi:MAG: type IV pili methyl-accepting chemotaxis transducer N-terminal domain-containing protein [Pseudomonadota bacterium]
MITRTHWGLGTKLALVASPFIALALLLIALTLWVSSQLDGGAAALNEAGRMRMQTFRLSLSLSTGNHNAAVQQARQFDASIALLRHGDAARPLFMPWDDETRPRFDAVAADWARFQQRWTALPPPPMATLDAETVTLATRIDGLVNAVETHLSRWTAMLHLLQAAMMALAVLGSAALLYTGYLFVLQPVSQLKKAIERLQGGDLSARVESVTRDEFGTLALGFNSMAVHLQSMYHNLEAKVSEKTVELEEKRERLETLYSMTTLVVHASSLEELARGFTERVARAVHADGVALRWSDEANERYLMLSSQGLPAVMTEAEHCIHAHECHCGVPDAPPGARVIPIRSMAAGRLRHCEDAGFRTLISQPIRLKDRLMGEVDLFYHAEFEPSEAERSLLEALTAHLASAMENLRLTALEKQSAVLQEREMLARELHDSIAQSLASLKIQVQLLRRAMDGNAPGRMRDVLAEIDLGVQECYADVRELLLNFRTRASEEDIEPALQTTLRKFEHQSGMKAQLRMQGHGLPLAPDVQVQVLHVVQEALSNTRKHSGATQVWLEVQCQPCWRFEVRDDGCGFDAAGKPDETHVGLKIMQERAAQIGAELQVFSTPGKGCSVILTLPSRPLLLATPSSTSAAPARITEIV